MGFTHFQSKFLGNSAATIMEGQDRIRFLNRPEDGEYSISVRRHSWLKLTIRCPTHMRVAFSSERCFWSWATCRRCSPRRGTSVRSSSRPRAGCLEVTTLSLAVCVDRTRRMSASCLACGAVRSTLPARQRERRRLCSTRRLLRLCQSLSSQSRCRTNTSRGGEHSGRQVLTSDSGASSPRPSSRQT